MGKLLSYSIISGLVMLAMYLAYKLFIARENQHGFNRVVLLAIYFISFLIYPLYRSIDVISSTSKPIAETNIVEIENFNAGTASQPIWGTILIWIFLLGMAIVTIRTIIIWVRIIHVINSGQKIKKQGYNLIVIDNGRFAPFSWMHYIVINRRDLEQDSSAIISHELKHVRSFHWIDLLIAQSVCILNWFNPAAWLMRDELMLVHEYQADMAVLESGHNPKEYQMLLIKKAVGARFPSLANSINHSKLKKRITMMYKSKSSAGSKLKSLALVPMAALAIVVATVPSVKAAVSTISNSEVSLDKGSENLPKSAKFKITSLNNSGIETTVVINGEGLGDYLSVSDVFFTNKGNRYNANSLNTNMTNGRSTITAVFPISDSYENANVTLTVNGKEVKLNLDDFRLNSQKSSISISPSNGIVISQGNATLSTVGDMEIFLDGKKIDEAEMKALKPENIATVKIDKQKNQMIITTR